MKKAIREYAEKLIREHVVAGDAASRRRGSSWPPDHSSRASGCTSGDLARDLLQEAFQAAIALSVSIADSLLRFLISGIAVL